MRRTSLSLVVTTADPVIVTRALEALVRSAAWLATEDVDSMLMVGQDLDVDEP